MALNIYITGMGGQGIAFLSRILIEACISAGHRAKGCDTHGLAQRGGIVVSHLRLGESVHTALIPMHKADIVIGLEKLEAIRGLYKFAAKKSTVIYYDVEYQPTAVRIGKSRYPSDEDFLKLADKKQAVLEKVFVKNLHNPRMQNIALLSKIVSLNIIPGLSKKIAADTMKKLLPESIKQANLELFENLLAADAAVSLTGVKVQPAVEL